MTVGEKARIIIHNKGSLKGIPGYTVEPPNKGQVGAWALVHYLGVVLYWGFFVKKPFLCVVRYNNYYYYKCIYKSVLEQQ